MVSFFFSFALWKWKLLKNKKIKQALMYKNSAIMVLSIILFYKSIFPSHNLPETINKKALSDSKKFKKLIYIVLDGLRFDSLIPVNKNGLYYNNMDIMLDDSINKEVFLSISGLPTITTSRIIGLMTGAPSSQLELIKAFCNRVVNIDNLTNRAMNTSRAFYGDSLWSYSFESLKDSSHTFCSFSKDNLVENENKVYDALIKNISDSQPDFLFAHFISLDSFGHTYGTENEKIKETLIRFNLYLKEIYGKMDNDTLMVVVSDHGVTNEGAHGGNSMQELASICGFFHKNKINTYRYNEKIQNTYISNFYDVESCNTEKDWIFAKSKYNIIHQDDIVVTVSYLLGIPIPYNSIGNLIPNLVNEKEAYRRLAMFKGQRILEQRQQKNVIIKKSRAAKKIIKKLRSYIHTDDIITSYVQLNYILSDELRNCFDTKSFIFAFIALFFLLCSLINLYSKTKYLMQQSHIIFVIIMVSHSYWSVASEDYLWLAAFLLENFSFSNVFAFIIYFRIPGRYFYDLDRIGYCIKAYRIFNNINIEILSLFVIYIIQNIIFTKNYKILRNWPQLLFALLRLNRNFNNRNFSMGFLSSFFSLNSLLAIHFKPLNFLLLELVLRNLNINFTISSKFSLQYILYYLCDLEYAVQSINYNTFFTFTDKFCLYSVIPSTLIYFLLPKLLFTYNFNKQLNPEKTDKKSYNLIFLIFLHVFCVFACFWFMRNSLVFSYFFLNRIIFITGFTLFDLFMNLYHIY